MKSCIDAIHNGKLEINDNISYKQEEEEDFHEKKNQKNKCGFSYKQTRECINKREVAS